jgi:3',5'-cyclic AMP phosphodiesterase CpdA
MTKNIVWVGGFGCLCLGLLIGIIWTGGLMRSKQFGSPNPEPKPRVVVIAGDIACDTGEPKTVFSCRSDETASLVDSIKPDAVLTTGDNQYPNGALQSFQVGYDKTWGKFKDTTYPTPGNHDYATAGAAGYFDYFGGRAGEQGKGYYTFKVGSWRFFALNSEIDVSPTSPQLAWLKQELDNSRETCSLAYWHKPRFSSGWHPGDATYDAVWRLLYYRGVDIVVNGHSHDYERFLPQDPDGKYNPAKGITEFVSGMGGKSSEDLGSPLPNLATRQNHAFGVLKLTLHPNWAAYQFVPIPGQQTFSDSGTLTCH